MFLHSSTYYTSEIYNLDECGSRNGYVYKSQFKTAESMTFWPDSSASPFTPHEREQTRDFKT